MKRFLSVILVLGSIAFNNYLRADGPPVDNETGRMLCKSVRFNLTESQVSQAERIGYIELNHDQISKLKKINPEFSTKYLMILPVPYMDCTCGMGLYGVWNKNESFEIPYSQILPEIISSDSDDGEEEAEDLGDEYEIPANYTIDSIANNLMTNQVNIDLAGRTYIRAKEVQLNEIFKMIDSLSYQSKHRNTEKVDSFEDMSIIAPVLTDKKVKDRVFGVMAQIKSYAKKKGFSCWDLVGFETEMEKSGK